METEIEKWSIKKLYANLNKINDQPIYQRGKVWSKMKNQLLIDSIFRGIDIPKFYLRKINNNGYNFEIADGQQRIHAIKMFLDDELAMPKGFVNGLELSKIKKVDVANKKLSEIRIIKPKLVEYFESEYTLTIAIINAATNAEIRTLFGRLQEGSTLNPAEKRNAILSPIGTHIDNFKFNHDFFVSCKIPPSRFRHQDYLAHVFALIIYNNKADLKADLLEKLYLDKADVIPINFIHTVSLVLDKMTEIDNFSKVRIKNKFSFIDIFYHLFINFKQLSNIDSEIYATFYDKLERKRVERRKDPEILIKDKFWGKDMYQYIVSYQSSGYEINSILNRNLSLSNLFTKFQK